MLSEVQGATARHRLAAHDRLLIWARVLHALTVDVEEYFQVSLFERAAPPASWDSFPRRAADSVLRLLELFAKHGAKATFFVLGWVAEREKKLLREIVGAGHQMASHSFLHRELGRMTPDELRADLRRARDEIASACGEVVRGFRAPSWSIGPVTAPWALPVLAEQGYAWDSSIFPIRHDRYGFPGRPRFPHVIPTPAGSIVEVPPATARMLGTHLAVAGGGWLRHLPFPVVRRGIASLEREGIPATVYVHPWEIDPDQPCLDVPLLTRVRHYRNISKVLPRLDRLLSSFRFGTVEAMLADLPPLPVLKAAEPAFA